MLTAYVFDRERGEEDRELDHESLAGLSEDHVLWVDLLDPSQDEDRDIRKGFGLAAADFAASDATGTANSSWATISSV